MKPFVIIKAQGKDITGNLGDRLLSVECHDEAEDKSDRCRLEIDDRPRVSDSGVVDLPIIGTVLEIEMGFRDGKSAKRGTYLIDDIDVTSPPRIIIVTGRAAAMAKSFRAARTQSYHQKTIGEIGKEIAERNGYEFVADTELSEIVIRHIDQHNESDMSFATRLAEEHDAVAKPVDGKLVFSKRGTGKSVNGKQLAEIKIKETDCEQWQFKYSARKEAGKAKGLKKAGASGEGAPASKPSGIETGDFIIEAPEDGPATRSRATIAAAADEGIISAPEASENDDDDEGGVRATWTDTRTGEKHVVTAGKEPYQDLRYSYHNEAEAVAAVTKAKNQASRSQASFSCRLGGLPEAQAEARLTLDQFRPYIPTLWRVKTCVHRFTRDGYVTTLDAELFNEKQSDVTATVKKSKPGKDDKVDRDAPENPTKAASDPKDTDDFIIEAPED
ncbi:phage late control D family protein [Brucella intermedia]|uniref:phage late control D family protein n=1 Tax=Brucella intermedia TaxID=94625 RepID=UPI002362F220|nr:contractile injection system protein, VgrG/Pvc8 family [Brucella intermedia]